MTTTSENHQPAQPLGLALTEGLGLAPERGERELAQAAWEDAEKALQRAHTFNVADLYAATLAARRRAMAAGINVMSQLRG